MGDNSTRDIEMGRLNADTTSAHGPEHYFQEVNDFGVLLDNTASMVQKLKETNQELNSVDESTNMEDTKGRMEREMDEVGKMAHTMKEKLNRIFQSVLTPTLNNLSNDRGYSVTLPMTMDASTKSMIRALKIKFKERKNDLENLRKTAWEEHLEVVQRTFTNLVFPVHAYGAADGATSLAGQERVQAQEKERGRPEDDLPEHVLEQILSRLGPYSPDLVRAAAAYRPWFRVVADAGFLARLAPTPHAGDYRIVDGRNLFVPSSPLDADGRRRFSLDFLPDTESWELADSRGSLLLLEKKFSCEDIWRHEYSLCRCFDVIVCDPLRARYQVIPWPQNEGRSDRIGLFLADGKDEPGRCRLSMSNFRIIAVHQQTLVYAVTTGNDGGWHDMKEEFSDDPESITALFFAGRANGSLYWGLEEDRTMVLVLDEATAVLSLARLPWKVWGLPNEKNARLIGGEDGVLRAVRLIGKKLYVFARRHRSCSDGHDKWVVEKRLDLLEATVGLPGRPESLLEQKIIIITANTEYILLSLSDKTWVFTVELDTMRVEREHPRNKYPGDVYPYKLPWPPVLSALSKEQYAVVRRPGPVRKELNNTL